jgi:hypothetical protein
LIGRQVSPNLRGVVKGLDDTFAKYHQQKIMTQITENKGMSAIVRVGLALDLTEHDD